MRQFPWRLGLLSLAALLALHTASAAAAPKPIKGKLGKRGYTVIALDETGEAQTTEAKPKFKLRPTAKRVSLHLQAQDGTYAGPVVVGATPKRTGKGKKEHLELRKKNGKKKGKKRRRKKLAIVGVKAGAKLGKVKVNGRKGYAKAKPKRKKQLDRMRTAKAKKGIPIGAGNFGLVRSKMEPKSPPDDPDADGVPDPLDIDDNGNLVLDKYERQEAARATSARGADPIATPAALMTIHAEVLAVNADGSVRAKHCGSGLEATLTWPEGSPPPIVGKVYEMQIDFVDLEHVTVLSLGDVVADGCPASLFVPRIVSGLLLTLEDTVNANAGDLTVTDFNDTLSERGFVLIGDDSTTSDDVTVELDCGGAPDPANPGSWSGGLRYCTRGGTGRLSPVIPPSVPPRSWPLAFPDCCDPDGDGFGEPGGFVMLSPGATTDQIGTGDVLNWRITTDGVESEFPTTLPDVFATVPALVSYRDGAGNSRTLSYPVPSPFVGSPPDLFGASEGPYQGFPVAACPASAPPPCVEGDVVVTFEFWRPQREAIPGEQGQWTDIGGLVYSVSPGRPNSCPQSQLSTTDPNLTPEPGSGIGGGGGFRDSAADRPADPANTLSFSVNMTKCFGGSFDLGGSGGSRIWLHGGVGSDFFFAPSGGATGGGATQQLYFTIE